MTDSQYIPAATDPGADAAGVETLCEGTMR